jgi:hypothetical protein
VKTSAPSTGIQRITLSGAWPETTAGGRSNRFVVIETKNLSDRGASDLIGVCVCNSQDPDTLLANLRKIPGVLSAHFG